MGRICRDGLPLNEPRCSLPFLRTELAIDGSPFSQRQPQL
jgi:hypothetical protein